MLRCLGFVCLRSTLMIENGIEALMQILIKWKFESCIWKRGSDMYLGGEEEWVAAVYHKRGLSYLRCDSCSLKRYLRAATEDVCDSVRGVSPVTWMLRPQALALHG